MESIELRVFLLLKVEPALAELVESEFKSNSGNF